MDTSLFLIYREKRGIRHNNIQERDNQMIKSPKEIVDARIADYVAWLKDTATSRIDVIEGHLSDAVALNFAKGQADCVNMFVIAWGGMQVLTRKAEDLGLQDVIALRDLAVQVLTELLPIMVPKESYFFSEVFVVHDSNELAIRLSWIKVDQGTAPLT